ETVRVIHLEELEERVQHAPDLSDVVRAAPLAPEGIELVEEVDAARRLGGVEDEAQLRGRLAHVLGDQAVELDGDQRQPELTGEGGRGHRLAGSRRTDEE